MRLAGKKTVVTGAASGLGRASAEYFAKEGASVIAVDINPAVQDTVDQINAAGGRAFAHTADLSSPAAAEEMARFALEQVDHIDVVYACAGVPGAGTAADTSIETWDRIIRVNLTSKWLTFKYFLPSMMERKSGSIIIQASAGGIVGVPGIFPYAAAKAGSIGMAKQAAVDYGPYGIRVNAIAPATVPTPLVIETYEARAKDDPHFTVEEGLRRSASIYPMRRLGTTDEFVGAAVYLASDESSWTTGHTMVVDGGFTTSAVVPD